MNTLTAIPVFYHVLPMRNRRTPKDHLHMKPELHSEVRIRAEPTWYLEDVGLFRINKTYFSIRPGKRGPQVSIDIYPQSCEKPPMQVHNVYNFKEDPGIHSHVRCQWRGRNGKKQELQRNTSHNSLRNVKRWRKAYVRHSLMHIVVANLILILHINSPLSSLLTAWGTTFLPSSNP